MEWLSINLEKKLTHLRNKDYSNDDFETYIKKIFDEYESSFSKIDENLKKNQKSISNLDFDKLDTSKIYHKDQIKKLCITYRLRFLSSGLFKNEIPKSTFHKINKIEKEHQTNITSFKIVAPSKMFRLINYDDPMLFTPIGNNYYYLIDKWGNDLSIFRKILVYPFRNLETFIVFLIILSSIMTCFIPEYTFGKQNPSVLRVVTFLFILKSVIGISIYYIFWKGKNFNSVIWNSKYSNHK